MFKKITLFAFAALLMGAFVFAAGTTDSKAPAAAAPAAAAPAKTAVKAEPRIEGTVQSVDAAKHTVTVMVGTEAKTFALSSKTVYMENGKKAKMVDLKAGTKVSIEADAKNAAKIVEVKQ